MGSVSSSFNTSYWVYNFQLSFDVSVKKSPWIWTAQSDLLIPEQILLLDMFLIKLDYVRYIIYWGFGLMGWKCMDDKFQVLSNVYFGAAYPIRFIYLENVFEN